MTPEKIMEIGFKIMQNQELVAKIGQAETPQEAFSCIQSELDGISFEEFVATALALAPMIPQVPDEQLEAMPNGALFKKLKGWVEQLQG